MKRKQFLENLTLLSVAPAAAAACSPFTALSPNKSIKQIKPKRLKPGDTVRIISPGSSITKEELNDTIENLKLLGLKAKYTENVLAKSGYLAGSDEIRAREVNDAFADNESQGILCARGGYGCARILPYINYDLILKNPKILCGYSDITALLIAINEITGLVCYHGPVGISTFNNFSIKYFKDVLMKPVDNLKMISESMGNNSDKSEYDIEVIAGGSARGYLTGGNLSIVASLAGTKYGNTWNDKILFLEEVGEEPYRIDRMLTQLILSDNFSRLKGIALGVFSNCEIDKEDPGFKDSFTLKEVIYDRLGNLGIPVVYGLSFGHINSKFTLPLGVKAELRSDSLSLALLENAVQ